MKHEKKPKSIVLASLLFAMACVGCGSGSGDEAEISKLPKDPAATPKPVASGGSIGGEEAVLVPQTQRPDGK